MDIEVGETMPPLLHQFAPLVLDALEEVLLSHHPFSDFCFVQTLPFVLDVKCAAQLVLMPLDALVVSLHVGDAAHAVRKGARQDIYCRAAIAEDHFCYFYIFRGPEPSSESIILS